MEKWNAKWKRSNIFIRIRHKERHILKWYVSSSNAIYLRKANVNLKPKYSGFIWKEESK